MNNGMHNQNQDARPGYKWTKLGWVPVEWEVVKLEQLCEKIMVGIASAATHAYRASGIPMFRNQNIKHEGLDDSDLLFIDRKYEVAHKNKRLKEGDVLTVRTGYPGVSAVVPIEYEGAQCFTSLITRPKKGFLNSQWLAYFINSPIGRKLIVGVEAGGAQKNVNAGVLSKLWIPLIPLPEQQKIATILSNWDRAIALTRQLITAKEEQKKGLMQRLLTGKVRVAGFVGEWEEYRLGEIGGFTRGKGISKKDLIENGNLPCVRYGEIYTKHHFYIKCFYSFIDKEVARQSQRLKQGDLLFASSGETVEDIGKSAAFLDDREVYAGGDIIILSPKDANSKYLGYALNQFSMRRQISQLGQGQSVVHIYTSGLKNISISIPSIQEQTAIANILTKADEEIDLLKAELAALQEQKQGLMQQLLTGQIRVKV